MTEKPMCGCKDGLCRIHKERPCPLPSRLDSTSPAGDEVPLCVPCGAHNASNNGYRLRVRPGDLLGR